MNLTTLCSKYGIKISPPTFDSRSRAIHKMEVADGTTLIVIGRELFLAGCKPRARISQWNDSTVVLSEQRKTEAWHFKFYAANSNQAEATLDELLMTIQPHRQQQEMLDL